MAFLKSSIKRRDLLIATGASLLLSGCMGRRIAKRLRAATQEQGFIGSLPADQELDIYRKVSGVADFSVRVGRNDAILYSRDVGSYGPTTQRCIASASKWLVAVTVMVQVDAGRLALDAPIGKYVPGLTPSYAGLRLDQLLSFTAGLPSLMQMIDMRQSVDLDLTESAQRISEVPLQTTPGTQFDYGGPNLQLIGAAVEQVNNLRWAEVFERDVAVPLGMTQTLWGRVRQKPAHRTAVRNPLLQGGAWSTATDICMILQMLAQNGQFGGRQILSAQSLQQLSTLHTLNVAKGFVPPGAGDTAVEYMIGHWCERRVDSECTMESSPGALGTYPWIDRKAGLYGVIFQDDRLQRVARDVRALRAKLITLYGTA
jgi:CubicO group peptidase (beta-lactamase class C family)